MSGYGEGRRYGVSRMSREMYNCRLGAEKHSDGWRWRMEFEEVEVGEMSRRGPYGLWPTTMHCYARWTCPM